MNALEPEEVKKNVDCDLINQLAIFNVLKFKEINTEKKQKNIQMATNAMIESCLYGIEDAAKTGTFEFNFNYMKMDAVKNGDFLIYDESINAVRNHFNNLGYKTRLMCVAGYDDLTTGIFIQINWEKK
jgi:hypothetical protein